MKFTVSILSLAACTLLAVASANEIRTLNFNSVPVQAKQELQSIIAENIAANFVRKLRENDSSRAPVLPGFNESIPIENAELNLDDLGLTDLISGRVALRNGELTGLNTVTDDLDITIIPIPLPVSARITYTLATEDVEVYGDYEADVLANYIYAVPISGAGLLMANISNVELEVLVRATVNVLNGRLTINSVEIDAGFESIFLYLEKLVICDEEINWDEVNEEAKDVFDQFWAENKAAVGQLVKDILSELLKDCNVYDFIGGDFSCIIPAAVAPKRNTNVLQSTLNYFTPIIPRLTCELLPTEGPAPTTEGEGPKPTTQGNEPKPTTDGPTDKPTTPDDDSAAMSLSKSSAGIFFTTVFILIATRFSLV